MSSLRELKSGSLNELVESIKQRIRKAPQNADLRAQLFQLLAIQGQWSKAADQLKLSGEMNEQAQPSVVLYINAIEAENERMEVLAGNKMPAVFAEPPAWMALLLQALQESGQQANHLREQALEMANAVAGEIETLDESVQPFEWLTDGDGRLGPVCEFISNNRYGWVPFEQIDEINLIKPDGLTDLIWAQAELRLLDGRSHMGLIPVRYPEVSETYQADEALSLAHKTEWESLSETMYIGHGQKVLIGDNQEAALLDIRRLRFFPAPKEQAHAVS